MNIYQRTINFGNQEYTNHIYMHVHTNHIYMHVYILNSVTIPRVSDNVEH